MKKYDEMDMKTLFNLLGYQENLLSVINNIQDKIHTSVQRQLLTESEVVVLVKELNDAYQELDEHTIEIEKSLDKKVRKLTGIRHLTQSIVKWNKEIDKMLYDRQNKKPESKKPDLSIVADVPNQDKQKD